MAFSDKPAGPIFDLDDGIWRFSSKDEAKPEVKELHISDEAKAHLDKTIESALTLLKRHNGRRCYPDSQVEKLRAKLLLPLTLDSDDSDSTESHSNNSTNTTPCLDPNSSPITLLSPTPLPSNLNGAASALPSSSNTFRSSNPTASSLFPSWINNESSPHHAVPSFLPLSSAFSCSSHHEAPTIFSPYGKVGFSSHHASYSLFPSSNTSNLPSHHEASSLLPSHGKFISSPNHTVSSLLHSKSTFISPPRSAVSLPLRGVSSPLNTAGYSFNSHRASIPTTRKWKSQVCPFCKQNGEEAIYHEFKDSSGRVLCPVLSKFKCKLCGATGFEAHTQKFCPLNPITKGDPIAKKMPPGLLPNYLTFKEPPQQD